MIDINSEVFKQHFLFCFYHSWFCYDCSCTKVCVFSFLCSVFMILSQMNKCQPFVWLIVVLSLFLLFQNFKWNIFSVFWYFAVLEWMWWFRCPLEIFSISWVGSSAICSISCQTRRPCPLASYQLQLFVCYCYYILEWTILLGCSCREWRREYILYAAGTTWIFLKLLVRLVFFIKNPHLVMVVLVWITFLYDFCLSV